MNAKEFCAEISNLGVDTIVGVPDSALKPFCSELQRDKGLRFKHYTPANEGAAVGIAVGAYIASGKPACVYMQNSGQGNMINPLASIANREVYGIPMLFLIGWRGEPGVKDEPQHIYQGKITCKLLEVMEVPYSVIRGDTSPAELKEVFYRAQRYLNDKRQFAIVIKNKTFDSGTDFAWQNGYCLNRESVLKRILEDLYRETFFVSTTGKISRELYEQCNNLFGNHDRLFMSVGGMGHASMIAFGIAQADASKRIVCVDGDGAALMHLGALAFIADQQPSNFIHILINNSAHESVGAMPTGYKGHSYAEIAKSCGYPVVYSVKDCGHLTAALEECKNQRRLSFLEIMVSLESRKDLGRPEEAAGENGILFMNALSKENRVGGLCL